MYQFTWFFSSQDSENAFYSQKEYVWIKETAVSVNWANTHQASQTVEKDMALMTTTSRCLAESS